MEMGQPYILVKTDRSPPPPLFPREKFFLSQATQTLVKLASGDSLSAVTVQVTLTGSQP